MRLVFTSEARGVAQLFYLSYDTHPEWLSVLNKAGSRGDDFFSISIPVIGEHHLIGRGIIFDCMIRLLSVEP